MSSCVLWGPVFWICDDHEYILKKVLPCESKKARVCSMYAYIACMGAANNCKLYKAGVIMDLLFSIVFYLQVVITGSFLFYS